MRRINILSEVNIVRPLEVIEAEINFYKQQTAIGIIEIGKRLIEAKAQLKHGQWGKWLEEKIDFSQSSANQFMRVAREFSNSESVKNLGTKKLFLLLDVPSDKREGFIGNNNIEEMSTRQLQENINNLQDKPLEIGETGIIDIEVEKFKTFPLHSQYFPNMAGDEWIRFISSVQECGVIEPIIISQDYVIISGHERVRACKDLNIKTIPCMVKKYIDNEKGTKQDNMLRDCLTANLKFHSDDFGIAINALKEHGWL
jgi:hypothetical protein